MLRSIFCARRGAVALAIMLAALPRLALGQEPDDHDHEHAAERDPGNRHLAHGHDGFPGYVDIFFTHHAYLERKLHPRFDATLAGEGNAYQGSAELAWQFGRRLGGEVEAGYLSLDPDEGEGESGIGDVEVAPMLVLLQDPARLLIVSTRSGFVLPTGDEDRGLGAGGWGWEPGLLVWKGFGADRRGALQAELGYERVFADEGEDEEELVYNLGVSWWLPSNWIPILEINGVTPLGDEAQEEEEHEEVLAARGLKAAHGEPAPAHDTLVSATVGFRYAFANGQQWGAGVQFPLNDDPYDVRVVVGGIIHID